MFRVVALLSVLAVASWAKPQFTSIDDLPAEYKDMVPQQAKDFLATLTEDDKKALKEVATNYDKYTHEDEVLAALKAKSPALHEKAEKLHKMIKDKIEALGDEAKAFAKELISDARKVQAGFISGNKPTIAELKDKVTNALEKYKALSQAARDDIGKQFPIMTSLLNNDKLQEMVKKFMPN